MELQLFQVAMLVKKYVGLDLTSTVVMYFHSVKLEPHMLTHLGFEDFDGKVDLPNLPIIGHTFVPIFTSKALRFQLYIHYKKYDHHNEPRLISVLEPNRRQGEWVVVKTFVSWKRTKYCGPLCPEYEHLLVSINWG
jgi:hypothetical protein